MLRSIVGGPAATDACRSTLLAACAKIEPPGLKSSTSLQPRERATRLRRKQTIYSGATSCSLFFSRDCGPIGLVSSRVRRA